MEEIGRMRKRLEITFAWDDGQKVPFPEGGEDGIDKRDALIRMLENDLDTLSWRITEVLETKTLPFGDRISTQVEQWLERIIDLD